MSEKVPCAECGTPIRPRKTDMMKGLCVRCFAKHRQRKATPLGDLYLDLMHRVHETDAGFDGLSEPERLYYVITRLRNEVNNGGFHQYFFNSSGSYYSHAEAGLLKLGATQTLALLHLAKEIVFPDEPVPTDTEIRRAHMFSRDANPDESELMRRLDELDQRFYHSPDDITPRLEAFARENGLVEAE